ncbi:MAG: hypothetical protein IT160_07320 [Bryobacterales bacterium]|nr:hypothetical protein [Bryobacterales bacterium]
MRALILALAAASALAQTPAVPKTPVEAPLFFREDWKETPPETPVTQAHVANPNLVLAVYGPGKAGVKKSHHDYKPGDPWYVWSGTANGNWAVTLRDRRGPVDLTGPAKIRWRTEQAGFRLLRVVLKLRDGVWVVSDQYDGPSSLWREHEFTVADLRWRRLNIGTITEGAWVRNPDLAGISEVGFTDLMAGGQSDACSRLDWIEVYGFASRSIR